jgi:hypothetical protein
LVCADVICFVALSNIKLVEIFMRSPVYFT